MMYKLWHWLFGWDYVCWSNICDQGIARVMVSHTRQVWYWQYKSSCLAKRISDPGEILWLTCHPSKYFPIGNT